MKPLYHSTQEAITQLHAQSFRWTFALQQWHRHIASAFLRPEPREQALLYLQAILSTIPRKNGWQIAEQAGQATPYRTQRLLSHAVWDQDGVRDVLRTALVQVLQPRPPSRRMLALTPFPLLALDESGIPKRGKHSAGVARQYCGTTGQVENCQVGVFLSYITERGHGLIDRELYLPEDWCHDPARRQAAHIPESVSFRTKPELAQAMVQRAQQAGIAINWVVADTVYGHSTELRLFLEQQGFSYALAVPSHERVAVQSKEQTVLAEVATLAEHVAATDWQRLSASLGSKGERFFDWAMLPMLHQGRVDARHFLVFRRCLDDPSELSYYLVWAPPNAPLSLIAQAIGGRWHIEEDLQSSKKLGLDQYEVRSYQGWYRHITLVLFVCAFLLSQCVQANASPPTSVPLPLIGLTCSEVQHLLAHLSFPPPTSAFLICHWSYWRRHHQYEARACHRRRREQEQPRQEG